jgi:hypothetical protein
MKCQVTRPQGVVALRTGVDANANPGTSIMSNRTTRCWGKAKNWPYRPKATFEVGVPGLHPGLMELALQAAIAKVAPQQSVQLHGL